MTMNPITDHIKISNGKVNINYTSHGQSYTDQLRFAIGKMDKLIIAKWDVIHRAIRDVKLALLHGAGGEFFQAQFHSQYLFSMAYKPFGNSGFFEDKKRLLELMLSKESFDSCPLFDECWEKIRQEVGMEPSSTKKEVWDTLPLLPGFSTKQTMPKLSRWFSWNESAQENVPEWSSLKLCLAYHFDDLNLDPDKAYAERQQKQSNNDGTKSATNMRKEFGRLKEKVGGGLKLCYHIMSEKLLQMVRIILMCTRPIWSWYSHAIKEIKHADHQVAKLVSLQREWVSERHLRRLAALPTSNLEELQVVLNMGISDTVPKVLELSQLLLKHRLWSLSKSAAPPDCYAGLLSADRDLQEAGWLLFISH